jgi:ferric-dicitrate binding protein FerR (iron transport regulator)
MEIDELIAKYLSNETSLEEVDEFMRWKEASPENESLFHQSEEVWRLAHDQQKYIRVDRERTWMKIEKRISRQYSLSVMLRVACVAASIALMLGLSLPYLIAGRKNVQSGPPQIISLYVPGGVCSKTILPDSTVVWLNALSSISYPNCFTGDTRTIELTGEAFFDVAHDENKPFIIQSGNIRVNVLGTSFNFKHYNGDTHAVLAVETGTVALSTSASKTTYLKAGQYANVNNRTLQTEVFDAIPTVTVKKKTPAADTTTPEMVEKEEQNNQFSVWRNYVLVFRDEPFSNILNQLARRYNVEFEIRDKEIMDYVYTATFDDMSIEDILKLIKISSPIDYTIKSLTSKTSNDYEKRKVTIFRK